MIARTSKFSRRLILTIVSIFLILNIVAAFHAYKFTHYVISHKPKTSNPGHISFGEKISAILFGINNPRPHFKFLPSQKYEEISIQSNKLIKGWLIRTKDSQGTVILFHGYGAEKSSMLDKSDEFLHLGYNTLLIDFMGVGESEGNKTTIGFKEAAEVESSYN